MLREIKLSRQDDPALRKRWFEDAYFDLFLWFRTAALPSGVPFHMQLCYGKPAREKAVSWRCGHGYFHDGVLSYQPGDVVAKSSLLQAGGAFDFSSVNARFLRDSANLDIGVRKFVLEKLHHFALHGPSNPARPGRINVRRNGFDAPQEEREEPEERPPPA